MPWPPPPGCARGLFLPLFPLGHLSGATLFCPRPSFCGRTCHSWSAPLLLSRCLVPRQLPLKATASGVWSDRRDQHLPMEAATALLSIPPRRQKHTSATTCLLPDPGPKRSCLQKVHSRWRKWRSCVSSSLRNRTASVSVGYTCAWSAERSLRTPRALTSCEPWARPKGSKRKKKKGHCLFFPCSADVFLASPAWSARSCISFWNKQHCWNFQSQITGHFPASSRRERDRSYVQGQH